MHRGLTLGRRSRICSAALVRERPADGAARRLSCTAAARPIPVRDGILVIKEQTDDNNRVAQEFYDSPLWPRFRFWEKFTWFCNGGERRARNQVLSTCPDSRASSCSTWRWATASICPGCRTTGRSWASTSPGRSSGCRSRASGPPVRLIQGEAETLPFRDGQFDAVLSIGAFNYFNDPEGALREMVRVARPGR